MNKVRKIYDSIHGHILIHDELIQDLIQAKEFQRLNRIKQLGFNYVLFPGATHTRYAHSIGTFEVARKFLRVLKKQEEISEKEERLILIAALLHDLGHGPFSHTFEELNSKKNHETYTIEIITSKSTEINKVLRKHKLDDEEIQEIASIIAKKHPKKWINQLISSGLDVDRLDYLMRDSFYTIANYGNLDIDWIIDNAFVEDDKIVFNEYALHSIENVLIGRYHMYSRVYLNPKAEAFDKQLGFLFNHLRKLYNESEYQFKTDLSRVEKILKNKELTVKELLFLTDDIIINLIAELNSKDGKEPIIKKLTTNILNGKLPQIFDLRWEKENKEFNQKIKNKQEGIEFDTFSLNETKYFVLKEDEEIYIKQKTIEKLSLVSLLIKSSIDSSKEEFINKEKKIGILI